VFESLSDRLTGALAGLRSKGRLTDADIEAVSAKVVAAAARLGAVLRG
jgi:signal recognition particle subunit SRP54